MYLKYGKSIHATFFFFAFSGAHVEGPFINPEKKGAHQEHLMKKVTERGVQDVEECYGSLDNISIITMAPELVQGNMSVIEELVKRNIVVSIGKESDGIGVGVLN